VYSPRNKILAAPLKPTQGQSGWGLVNSWSSNLADSKIIIYWYFKQKPDTNLTLLKVFSSVIYWKSHL